MVEFLSVGEDKHGKYANHDAEQRAEHHEPERKPALDHLRSACVNHFLSCLLMSEVVTEVRCGLLAAVRYANRRIRRTGR